jgi:hypothetical protein
MDLTKNDMPFLFGDDATLHVVANVPDLNRELTPSDTDLFALGFNASSGHTFAIGESNTLKLGIDAGTSVRLVALWPTSSPKRLELLEALELENFFASNNHSDQLLLLLLCGGNADASLSGKLNFPVLSLDTSLKAGADASYTLVRSYRQDTTTAHLITDFFGGLRLPANVSAPLRPDEVIAFEYGGYLKLGASIGAGYQLIGGHSLEIGDLDLNEKYDFSLAGKLSLEVSIAGRFRVEVRSGTDEGWARVTVHKSRQKSFSIAADVQASAKFEEEGLPDSPDEFISAILGLKAKNWINLFDQARKWTDFDKLEENLDELAKSYIELYTNRTFDELADRTKLDELVNKFSEVISSYNDTENHAVTLFDRYFNVAQNAVDQTLDQALKDIKSATSWDNLKSKLNTDAGGILWDVVNQLTEGDPLGWALGHIKIGSDPVTLDTLKGRVDSVFTLIQDDGHKEIRKVIALAKAEFPLDHFLQRLEGINFLELRNISDRKLVGFVERLIGKTIKGLNDSDLRKAVTKFHKVLDAVKNFESTAFAKFQEALNESYQFHFHAEYSRATEQTALIDFDLDLRQQAGKDLMKAAGHGDFAKVLANSAPDVVRLHEGVLTHTVTRQSKLSVNIVGWHLNWNYEALDRLITEAEQRISTDAQGNLTIDTTFDLNKERERKRNGERIYTNMVLSFIGQSKGNVQFDRRTQSYLVNAITGMAARYNLVFDDPNTTHQELAQYSSFADDLGLAESDTAAEAALEPLLPTDAQGNFGDVKVRYDVRFTEAGLQALFTKPFTVDDEAFLRRTMRLLVLTNYLNKGPDLARRAWCYWTPGVFQLWQSQGASFANHIASMQFQPIAPSPLKNLTAPASVILSPIDLAQLNTLYLIEKSMIEGLRKLSEMVVTASPTTPISPRHFEDKMVDFGNALKLYDDFDEGDNTVFALFDRLIQRAAPGARNSSLTLTSTLQGTTTTKMLIA